MKPIIQKLWILIAILCAFISASAYDFEVDGIYYDLNATAKTAVVTYATSYNKASYEGNVIIPPVVKYLGNDIPVKAIGEYAFNNCNAMISISIPESISSIGKCAFSGCSKLETIDLPYGIKRLESSTFAGCNSLSSIEIPDDVTYIGNYCFESCKNLEEVKFPDNIEILPTGIFEECAHLKRVVCPSQLKVIEPSAFRGCDSLEDVVFNNVIETIGYSAFQGCSSIQNIFLPSSIKELGTGAFENCINLKTIKLPSNLSEINIELFKGCESLKTLEIPSNVHEISTRAFSGCSSLHKIKIPSSVVEMGLNVFNGTMLDSLVFEDADKEIYIPNYQRKYPYPGQSNTYYTVNEYCKIPSTLTYLYCGRNIRSGKEFRSDYDGEKENNPFYGCINLKNINVGVNVSDLTLLDVTRYENLDSIKLFSSMPPSVQSFTANQFLKIHLCIPLGALDSYQKANVWRNFWNINEFVIPISSIKFEEEEFIMNLNESKIIKPSISPGNASIKEFDWESSNPNVVSVSENGTITSNENEGEAIITATAVDGSGVSAPIKVAVKDVAGISDIITDGKVSIQVENDKIVIYGKRDSDVADVYNIQGQRLVTTTQNVISVNVNGVIIVKVGSLCKKVTLL